MAGCTNFETGPSYEKMAQKQKPNFVLIWNNNNECAIGSDKGKQVEFFTSHREFEDRIQRLFTGERECRPIREFIGAYGIGAEYKLEAYEVITKIRPRPA